MAVQRMKKLAEHKTVIVFLFGFALVVASHCPACLAQEDLKITWQDETLSADLSGVPLEQVLEYLSDEEQIWFKLHNSVADRKVCVRFKELSLEQGLRRILTGLDYSLEFDGQGKPCGIVIVGEKESASTRGRAGRVTPVQRRVPKPEPDTTKEDNDEDDEQEETPPPMGGPYGPGPGKPPVDASADEGGSPFGPGPSAPVESDETFSPYGPGDVNPARQRNVRKPRSSDQSAQQTEEGQEVPPEDADTASP